MKKREMNYILTKDLTIFKFVRMTKDLKMLSSSGKLYDLEDVKLSASEIIDLFQAFIYVDDEGEPHSETDLEPCPWEKCHKVAAIYGALYFKGPLGEPILRAVAKMGKNEKDWKLLEGGTI